ncbi:hypothetical protein MSAN_00371300 [Mycena sanguinolenta]|uniref:Uncharacterized protein n=1 Tax=Mycena sanguinolenta TaxID=230812 RepID=A0A8H6Z975_9AGAR|nr:hypothetical protein MSAN_00371300 [Mycena sanguinolenta]
MPLVQQKQVPAARSSTIAQTTLSLRPLWQTKADSEILRGTCIHHLFIRKLHGFGGIMLSCMTHGSSASAALSYRKSNPSGDGHGTNIFSIQFKQHYNAITDPDTYAPGSPASKWLWLPWWSTVPILLTADAVYAAWTSAHPAMNLLASPAAPTAKSVSDIPAPRMDNSSSPSIAVAAAQLLDNKPEKEHW